MTSKDFTEQLVGLGLASDSKFIQRLLIALKNQAFDMEKTEKVELLTLKDFLKVFEYDKFGQKACQVIKQEFKAKLKQQIDLQKGIMQAYVINRQDQIKLSPTLKNRVSPRKSPKLTQTLRGTSLSKVSSHSSFKSNFLHKIGSMEKINATTMEKINEAPQKHQHADHSANKVPYSSVQKNSRRTNKEDIINQSFRLQDGDLHEIMSASIRTDSSLTGHETSSPTLRSTSDRRSRSKLKIVANHEVPMNADRGPNLREKMDIIN